MAKPKNNLIDSKQNNLNVNTGIPALKSLLATEAIRRQMKSLLGEKAGHFMMAIVGVVEGNYQLQECEPQSIINSALVSATLDLPIEKNLGYAYIVPYKDNKKGYSIAQFQLGYKGFIQLALRSGQYKYINSIEIKKDELKHYNLLTGEFTFEFIEDINKRLEAETIGYASYIEFNNGFRNTLYMTKEQVKDHAEKYSQSYGYDIKNGYNISNWSKNFDAMALKTVLKLNLSKYGALSVNIQKALQVDGSAITEIKEDGTMNVEFIDNGNQNEIVINDTPISDEDRLELLKNADLISFDIKKKANELKINFDSMTKSELSTLQEIIDIETENRM